MNFFLIN